MTLTNQITKDPAKLMTRHTTHRVGLLVLATTLLLALLLPALASAGTETIYTCRNADGSPGSDADWKAFSYDDPSSTGSVGHLRACGSGQPLETYLIGSNFTTSEYSSLHFEVPSGLAVTRILRLDRETQGLGRTNAYSDRIWYVGNKASSGGYV
ncbi:MAG: hypothetical protein QOD24_2269, partial [Solirubrobacteraceae bacterium]|nr:hypothetical protein [Solirubrobacteraceae bacterium]